MAATASVKSQAVADKKTAKKLASKLVSKSAVATEGISKKRKEEQEEDDSDNSEEVETNVGESGSEAEDDDESDLELDENASLDGGESSDEMSGDEDADGEGSDFEGLSEEESEEGDAEGDVEGEEEGSEEEGEEEGEESEEGEEEEESSADGEQEEVAGSSEKSSKKKSDAVSKPSKKSAEGSASSSSSNGKGDENAEVDGEDGSDSDSESDASGTSIPSDEDTADLDYGSDSDDSDDEAEKNRIGNVPLQWYDDLDHIGYDIEGEKIGKTIQKSEIDQLLKRFDDPNAWRTITDVKNQEEIVLTDRDMEAIHRIRNHMMPAGVAEQDWHIEFENKDSIHPVRGGHPAKRGFLPSKHEGQKIKKLIRLIREGKLLPPQKKKKDEVFDIWHGDADERKKAPTALPAPKMALPTHAESFNPPEEYLFTEEEKKEWEAMDESERPISFIPEKFGDLRRVPAFKNLITERFERCLDLYLVPRALAKKMNVEKESLLPKLPSPSDLRPFPMGIGVTYDGHTDLIRGMAVDCRGEYLATVSQDKYCIVWDVLNGRPARRLKFEEVPNCVQFHPKDSNILVVGSDCDVFFINLNLHPAWSDVTEEYLKYRGSDPRFNGKSEETQELIARRKKQYNEENKGPQSQVLEGGIKSSSSGSGKNRLKDGSDDEAASADASSSEIVAEESSLPTAQEVKELQYGKNQNPRLEQGGRQAEVVWRDIDDKTLRKKGFRLKIRHDGIVAQLVFHRSGTYLACVSPNAKSTANQCIIHALAKHQSLKPFGKMKGGSTIQRVIFHPAKPLFFVCTQKTVRVYHLQQQQMMKQLVSGAKWISSVTIHPSGDHLVVGTYDRRVIWFDLDLGVKPYKTLKYHDRGVRQVAFHPAQAIRANGKASGKAKFPLMATASDDGSVHVFHTKVYDDFTTNPLLVPVKKLKKNEEKEKKRIAQEKKLMREQMQELKDGNFKDGNGDLTLDEVRLESMTPIPRTTGHSVTKQGLGVMDTVWHPTQPWVFSAGADGKAFMWV